MSLYFGGGGGGGITSLVNALEVLCACTYAVNMLKCLKQAQHWL